jgi:ribosomal protein L21
MTSPSCGVNREYTKLADTGFSSIFVTQGLDDKVIIFKFKKKKKYQRKAGHRQVSISTCRPHVRWKYSSLV